MRLRDRWLLLSTSLTTIKFVHLHSNIRTFFEQVFHKIFWMLLGYTVAKAPASPRNSTWFTRPFLLVRGWGLGTRLSLSLPSPPPIFFLLSLLFFPLPSSHISNNLSFNKLVMVHLHSLTPILFTLGQNVLFHLLINKWYLGIKVIAKISSKGHPEV